MKSILIEQLEKKVFEVEEYCNQHHSQDFRNPNWSKVLGVFFDEPSTRNRFSVSSAAQRLGYSVVTCDDLSSTSLAKGETIIDTAEVISNYFDAIAVRSRLEGFAGVLSSFAKVPVINLGDGSNEHPTQALATLVTIKKKFGNLKGVRIVIWGDLEMGRVAHSLFLAAVLAGLEVILVPYKKFEIPKKYLNIASTISSQAKIEILDNIENVKNIDVLYLNRQQTERRAQKSKSDYNYYVSEKTIDIAKLVLHPLPKGSEIPIAAWYLRHDEIMEHVKTTYLTRQWVINEVMTKSTPFVYLVDKNKVPTSGSCSNSLCKSILSLLPDQQKGINIGKIGNVLLCKWCLSIISSVTS